jgi:hypothetical protein
MKANFRKLKVLVSFSPWSLFKLNFFLSLSLFAVSSMLYLAEEKINLKNYCSPSVADGWYLVSRKKERKKKKSHSLK